MPESQLELRLQQRERRPQLVARIRDETPLTGESVADPRQHLVQRLSQPRNLVAARRDGQPVLERRRRDVGGSPPHRLDRA